jgi:hypothetical protein
VFRLDEDVQKAFQEPAELLVHAKIGEKQGIARATVVSGRLQDARQNDDTRFHQQLEL